MKKSTEMKKVLSSLALVVLFAGCAAQQIPYRVFMIDLKKGTATIKDPHDFAAGHLHISAGTNGVFDLTLDNATNSMNPAVIQTSGVATADAINAFGNQFSKAVELGVKAAGKAIVP